MKMLQPEMTRIKELHKDDRAQQQQALMALYKKEKVNPISGCLPILIQIPFFFAIYKCYLFQLKCDMPFLWMDTRPCCKGSNDHI